MDKNTEKLLKKIGKVADAHNVEVYAVGGFVRDLILGKACVDLDFVVVGDGISFAHEVAKALKIKNVIEYEKFHTAFLPYKEYKIEFVSARAESYEEMSRKPIVEIADLKSDILRRDFTINTLAYGINAGNFGEIIDILGGQKDLGEKIIRTPLDPVETFKDDPLRIMRAIRFASKLQFNIEEETYAAIKQTVNRLDIISMERIRDELLKIMESRRPSVGLWLLYDTGILQKILPELCELYGVEDKDGQRHKNNFSHTLKVVDNIAQKTNNVNLRLAALFHDIGKAKTKKFIDDRGWTFHNHEFVGAKMIRPIFYRLKLSKDASKYVTKLVRLHMRPIALTDGESTDSGIRRLIFESGEHLEDLLTLASADITSRNPKRVSAKRQKFEWLCKRIEEVEEKDRMRAFHSPVRGEEIMELCNLKPGKEVGIIKKQIEEAILDGVIPNEYEAAKQYLLEEIIKK